MTDTLIPLPKVIINLQEEPPQIIELIEAIVGKPGPIGPKGDRGFTWKGVYSSATEYEIDHVVFYNNVSYICILGCTNIVPTNVTYWEVFPLLNEVTLDALNAGLMDNRYYTESEVNGLLNAKAPIDHDHLKADITDFAHTHVKADVGLGNVDNTSDTDKPISTAQQTAINTKVDKLMATNIIDNGDLSNGITGYTPAFCTLSVVSNTLLMTGDGSNAYPQFAKVETYNIAGKKIYTRMLVRLTTAYAGTAYIARNVRGSVSGTINETITNPTVNQWYTMSSVVDATTFVGTLRHVVYHQYADASTALGKVMEVKQLFSIDLTTLFGAGKEPSALEMDNLLANFPNSWFNGTQELINYKELLLDVNGKANKVQEAWITPTFLNGWVNFETSAYEPCQYFKDSIGIVHVKGFIKSGVIGQTIFNLPTGYRPTKNIYFTAYSNEALAQMTLSSVGDLKCRLGNNVWVAFYIHFRGDV